MFQNAFKYRILGAKMAIDILKDTQIRKAIKKEKDYSLTDGGGLAILITSKDVKRWVFYYIDPASGKKM